MGVGNPYTFGIGPIIFCQIKGWKRIFGATFFLPHGSWDSDVLSEVLAFWTVVGVGESNFLGIGPTFFSLREGWGFPEPLPLFHSVLYLGVLWSGPLYLIGQMFGKPLEKKSSLFPSKPNLWYDELSPSITWEHFYSSMNHILDLNAISRALYFISKIKSKKRKHHYKFSFTKCWVIIVTNNWTLRYDNLI